jgi:hypothetical protein
MDNQVLLTCGFYIRFTTQYYLNLNRETPTESYLLISVTQMSSSSGGLYYALPHVDARCYLNSDTAFPFEHISETDFSSWISLRFLYG